ncbi:MAG: sensor histidine kinase [Rhodoferax sp.]
MNAARWPRTVVAQAYLRAMPFFSKHGAFHGLRLTLLVNTAIAVGITLFDGEGFWTNMLYSHCIGFSISAAINTGVRHFIRDKERQLARLVFIVPTGVVLGFVTGVVLAQTLMGAPVWVPWLGASNKVLGLLFLSLVAGVVMSHTFVSREQLAAERERAAQAQAQVQAALHQSAQAQLQLLQSQLEPHMLFNTLANLRVLMGLDVARAQTMLDHLVAFLRATLDASRATEHALAQEFARLRDYLELMQVRMGPRLRYQLNLPPELAQQGVPPLLLQSLVENSIQHGLEPQVAGGTVRVSASAQGERLRLVVQDDGVGSPTDLNQADAGATRFGVAQVRERLQTRYGAQGTLFFEAPEQGGTRATIEFPCTK